MTKTMTDLAFTLAAERARLIAYPRNPFAIAARAG
jgi:hypothetical protein